jgi:hypothetical protein
MTQFGDIKKIFSQRVVLFDDNPVFIYEPLTCMRPDYPYKVFYDERGNYVFLLESLATDGAGALLRP